MGQNNQANKVDDSSFDIVQTKILMVADVKNSIDTILKYHQSIKNDISTWQCLIDEANTKLQDVSDLKEYRQNLSDAAAIGVQDAIDLIKRSPELYDINFS